MGAPYPFDVNALIPAVQVAQDYAGTDCLGSDAQQIRETVLHIAPQVGAVALLDYADTICGTDEPPEHDEAAWALWETAYRMRSHAAELVNWDACEEVQSAARGVS